MRSLRTPILGTLLWLAPTQALAGLCDDPGLTHIRNGGLHICYAASEVVHRMARPGHASVADFERESRLSVAANPKGLTYLPEARVDAIRGSTARQRDENWNAVALQIQPSETPVRNVVPALFGMSGLMAGDRGRGSEDALGLISSLTSMGLANSPLITIRYAGGRTIQEVNGASFIGLIGQLLESAGSSENVPPEAGREFARMTGLLDSPSSRNVITDLTEVIISLNEVIKGWTALQRQARKRVLYFDERTHPTKAPFVDVYGNIHIPIGFIGKLSPEAISVLAAHEAVHLADPDAISALGVILQRRAHRLRESELSIMMADVLSKVKTPEIQVDLLALWALNNEERFILGYRDLLEAGFEATGGGSITERLRFARAAAAQARIFQQIAPKLLNVSPPSMGEALISAMRTAAAQGNLSGMEPREKDMTKAMMELYRGQFGAMDTKERDLANLFLTARASETMGGIIGSINVRPSELYRFDAEFGEELMKFFEVL